MSPLDTLRDEWDGHWEDALACWSRFTRLRRPRWCLTEAEEQEEGLTGSFAMIRLVDQAVVISLRQVAEKGLERFATEVLAHEIGHHVLAPGDLGRHARSLARIRVGLPGHEPLAPFIANLYTDLLINDRLQRQADLDIAGVYRMLGTDGDRLWTLYLRTYEILWSLQSGTLATGKRTSRLESDAGLAARLIRVYGHDWLEGSGRFAALCLPYLTQDTPEDQDLSGWHDTAQAGQGGAPSGLSRIEPGELDGALHPAFDPLISGISAGDLEGLETAAASQTPFGGDRDQLGGVKTDKEYRGPVEYGELLKMSGLDVTEAGSAIRYYRERAVPHLVPFPSRVAHRSSDPLPEGLEPWNLGDPLEAADWFETAIKSPHVIPGMTTVQRRYGDSEGADPERRPVDLYVGVDCSGSMPNPRRQVSFPALAGVIVGLSALKAGASVMVALSGEPGQTVTTDGFVRDETAVLTLLTEYLGCGWAYGVHRLAEAFGEPRDRPAHILIVSDQDLFMMLGATTEGLATKGPWEALDVGDGPLGWQVAEEALAAAGGGGTIVLDLATRGYATPDQYTAQVERLREQGWAVHFVSGTEELVAFARAFAREVYAGEER